ncbi:hypothetical protein N7447_000078 [Penicillium robsamsonii]|uniref:uncharacterized protein n=1 Tax=Penicillium robsamsonii TaxID=1792511 RepID=UPI0025482BAA|nr:uncharacterized protein N7447_000078 [Penicillium robsamsonii]KAJ5834052.1 hypothetical protein N7447_000078 [Penicillium robsamsonii]
MKFFIVLLAIAAYAMAEAGPDLEARAGCSLKGQFCNFGGTFRCCSGQGTCIGENPSSITGLIWPNMIADG